MSGHLNFMEGTSYDVSPLTRLQMVAASCFFGEPQYYRNDPSKPLPSYKRRSNHSIPLRDNEIEYLRNVLNAQDPREWRSMTPQQVVEKTIDEALAFDAEKTLGLAVELRSKHNIRTTPQVIAVRAANNKNLKGSGLVRKYNSQILTRADEAAVQLAYQLSAFGKPIPNSLKRSWKDFIEKQNEFALAKYKNAGKASNMFDVVNLVHAKSPAVEKLMSGNLVLKDDNVTWESLRSSGASWKKCIPVMGHMALLRNLRNFLKDAVDPQLWLNKLIETAENGRQLPFRYYSAYKAIQQYSNDTIDDALEECLRRSLVNLPRLSGKSVVATDNSGSAHGAFTSQYGKTKIAEIGNLMGLLTSFISESADLYVFGDNLLQFNFDKEKNILKELEKMNQLGLSAGGNTEHGVWLMFDKLIANKEHVDNIFVYSDMQAGHGGLYGDDANEYRQYMWNNSIHIDVPKLVKTYRNKVNPDVRVFLVQIAGYEDTLLPEYYDKTYIIGGWSDRIFHFAKAMEEFNV